MEGLPYDFGIEDDSDDDESDVSVDNPERLRDEPPTDKAEIVDPKKLAENILSLSQETLPSTDTAPELDAEAPLEHLSSTEFEAISQTLASERLAEIRSEDEQLSNETFAAESFLENVEASGDLDRAYNETLIELGDSEPETSIPPAAEAAIKSELAPDTDYLINQPAVAAETGRKRRLPPAEGRRPQAEQPTSAVETDRRPMSGRAKRVRTGIVDFIVERRKARIAVEEEEETIARRLTMEVDFLGREMERRENRLRQLAMNRPPIPKAAERLKSTLELREESIGKVVVEAGMPKKAQRESPELVGLKAHTMKHNELLKVADKIEVEGNTLRQIYEARLVTDRGLRRIVAEHLRGGNVKKLLRRELIQREIDFERDPMLRDQGSTSILNAQSADLDQLLEKTGIDWSEPSPVMPPPKEKKRLSAKELLPEVRSAVNPIRKVADVIMIGTIIALAAIITVLLLER